jgi:hypothetical protein
MDGLMSWEVRATRGRADGGDAAAWRLGLGRSCGARGRQSPWRSESAVVADGKTEGAGGRLEVGPGGRGEGKKWNVTMWAERAGRTPGGWEADSREPEKSTNKFLSPLHTF